MDRILINDLLKIPDCDIGKNQTQVECFQWKYRPFRGIQKRP